MKRHQKYIDELIAVVLKVSSDKQFLHDFLADLLTPKELEEMAIRWQIIKQLDREVPQWEIVKNLKVGVNTVTRGMRTLYNQQGGFNRALRLKAGRS